MTFSVLGHDPRSGMTGVAIASCVLAIGARAVAIRPGVGIAVGQAGSQFWHPISMLDLLAASATAAEVVAAMRALDAPQGRQFAVLDTSGVAAAWTGPSCTQEATHQVAANFAAQGNTLARGTIAAVEASWNAYSDQALPQRLLAALTAGQQVGGDLRGQQSAALIVLGDDEPVNLRVDDAERPLDELHRLLTVDEAHRALRAAISAAQRGDRDAAAAHAARGLELAPRDPQLRFWAPALAGHIDHLDPAGLRRVAAVAPWAGDC